ncbi:GNAT family N-acetyltransferase [Thalassomonas actiniarum]|uniref:GNAT family N-acetyltransferase n=1 Tax=Thalassomonas actiniarum TaxID=485447 RepID=A0AAE9YMF5_9GAMM|nr:GNAT family protein [Thalassomonas actiniarum]WDD97785.1 GNAT family N-acetyltransferase [Thalassomonas actiniarum]
MDIHLTSSRLTIRALAPGDLHAFAQYRALPEVALYQSWSQYSYQEACRLYESMSQQAFATLGYWFQLALIERDTHRLIGDLAVHFIDEQQVEIGVTVAPEYQGLAREAIYTLLDYLFLELKKHRVTAVTDADNQACTRLLKRVGFRQEAHFVDNIFFKGVWGSEYVFAMLASDWSRLRR